MELGGDVDSVAFGVEVLAAELEEEVGGTLGEDMDLALVVNDAAHGLGLGGEGQNFDHVLLVFLSDFSVVEVKVSGEFQQSAVGFVSDLFHSLTFEDGVGAGV